MEKVSVLLTSYNQGEYLSKSIESILGQSYEDFELLICDDGSTDNSQEIIKQYKDSRIKLYLYSENRGSYYAIQEALKESTGKYFALQHSDDIWESDKLARQVEFLEENPKYEVCFTQANFIDETGANFSLPENHPYKNVFNQKNRTREEWLNYLFWHENCFCNPSLLMKNQRGNFSLNPNLRQLPDYFMWINFCLKNSPFVLPEKLIKFRLRRQAQNSVSSQTIENLIRLNNELYIIAKAFLPLVDNPNEFLEVFPEAEKFVVDGEFIPKFAFAQLCQKKSAPAFQKLALDLLYNLLSNSKTAKKIKKLYGYEPKNFIADAGRLDSFNIKSQIQILNCRLYADFGNGFNEADSFDCPTMLRQNFFTAVFNLNSAKEIFALRFDPNDKPALSLKILNFTVNGVPIQNFSSNADFIQDNKFIFLSDDPNFTVFQNFNEKNLHVEITGEVFFDAFSIATDNLQQKNSQINQLQTELQEKISQINQLQAELQEKISQINQLQTELQEKISQIVQLLSEIQQRNFQINQLQTELQEKDSQIVQLQIELQEKDSQIRLLTQKINNLKNLYNEILNSNSWKITKPLRSVAHFFKNL